MISDKLGRFQIDETTKFEWGTKLTGTFDYRDMRGQVLRGTGNVFVPTGEGPWPLHFQAGYEIPDAGGAGGAQQGVVVVNPPTPPIGSLWPGENPLARSVNLDVALLHIARSFDCVDDSRVTLAGGSAGGWMTWMLTAETFPLAGSMPGCPPVNWGYNSHYVTEAAKLAIAPDGTLVMPGLAGVFGLVRSAATALGDDFGADIYFQHSPVAHVDEVTCPLRSVHATSDLLVPIDQISRSLVRPLDGACPEGYATHSEGDWLTLEDAMPDLHIEVVGVPEGAHVFDIEAATSGVAIEQKIIQVEDSDERVVVYAIDDGPPGPRVGHFKYAVVVNHNAWLERMRSAPCDAAAQLTPAKRALLDKRLRGEEWIASPLPHLDFPEAERADVERALSHVD